MIVVDAGLVRREGAAGDLDGGAGVMVAVLVAGTVFNDVRSTKLPCFGGMRRGAGDREHRAGCSKAVALGASNALTVAGVCPTSVEVWRVFTRLTVLGGVVPLQDVDRAQIVLTGVAAVVGIGQINLLALGIE